MIAILKQLTLDSLIPLQWRQSSYIYRSLGIFSRWRDSSFLLQWSEEIGAVLISVLIAIAPFSATSLIGVLLLCIALYWVLLTISEQNPFESTPIHLLVFLYWLIATLAVALSPVKAAALSGWIKLTLYLVFFALTSRVLRSTRRRNGVVTAFLLVAAIVSVYGIRQEIFGAEQLATWNDPTSEMAGDTRAYSYLGNPNLLAAYLLPAIAFSLAAVFVWQGWLPKALAGLLFVINSACLYFTDSRGGWLGMMALMVVFMILLYVWFRHSLSPFWRTWLLPLVLGFLGIMLLGGFIFIEPLRIRILSMFAGRDDSSNNFRLNVWESVINMIKARPVLGIGPGNEAFNQVYPLYMKPRFSALSAYSIYLETAVETGLIGLTCFLSLLGISFSTGVWRLQGLQKQDNLQGFWLIAAIAGMAGILTHGFFDTVWYRPQVSTLWWLMIAVIASLYPLKNKQEIF
ncbi:IctB family putative bicarbonate transporter [Chroococcus sp. FPU101]|uniref:IctB family putative bicarbonate transporter n=1 Tax=Chroococcus sp. FPU101 TaxID=1974212 RepID=UPI001A8E782B|nr:IctB family putative bicarbonate transporter [Chroococcus sp. FPU101]GFE69157.1 O-antigen polymerase [Chroococcus sp. FPU101]